VGTSTWIRSWTHDNGHGFGQGLGMDVGLDMDTDMDLYITRFCEIMKAHNSAELVVTLSNKSY
jgi:hypothetical protein